MEKIVINDETIMVDCFEEKKGDNNELQELYFSLHVRGKGNYYVMKDLLKDKIKVYIPKTKTEVFAKVKSSDFNPVGALTDSSFIELQYTLVVVNEDEVSSDGDFSFEERLAVRTIKGNLKVDALIELLIDKGIITEEEFNHKFQLVEERDSKGLVEEIVGVPLEGLTEKN
ncbi:hypothetical protein [Bacillus toyonensis]|uniref:hypothetical protein n=1 Tax=Bacillus toyonensis TaxID=155322 RepID=UPI00240555B7|nr:hypothetical protein [Bacillus toyonensis]MDF9449479.1 hypothetical protein [Bacillus toyonensis]MDG1562530.1 hypothetical protein [Bacillus toyonensis]